MAAPVAVFTKATNFIETRPELGRTDLGSVNCPALRNVD
jgi:hypothetical protein